MAAAASSADRLVIWIRKSDLSNGNGPGPARSRKLGRRFARFPFTILSSVLPAFFRIAGEQEHQLSTGRAANRNFDDKYRSAREVNDAIAETLITRPVLGRSFPLMRERIAAVITDFYEILLLRGSRKNIPFCSQLTSLGRIFVRA